MDNQFRMSIPNCNMKVKVRTVESSKLDQLENILNELLQKPAYRGFGLVSAFPGPDYAKVVLVFQKPGNSQPPAVP